MREKTTTTRLVVVVVLKSLSCELFAALANGKVKPAAREEIQFFLLKLLVGFKAVSRLGENI